jgi:hypothetical protein
MLKEDNAAKPDHGIGCESNLEHIRCVSKRSLNHGDPAMLGLSNVLQIPELLQLYPLS